MNETIETLLRRRACRSFKKDLPEQALLDQVIQAGLYAPSGRGLQSAVLVAVTDKALRDRLSSLNASFIPDRAGSDPFYGAPAVILVLADKNVPTHVCDASLAAGNMMNAAASLGLATCWIHRGQKMFASESGKALLADWGLSEDLEGLCCIIIGYPADDWAPEAAPRKPARAIQL